MTEVIIKKLNVIGEGSFIIPSGYFIQSIFIVNKSDNDIPNGIKFGTLHGVQDIIGGFYVSPNSNSRLDNVTSILDFGNDTTIFFDAVSNWNSGIVDIIIILKNLE